MDIPMTAPRKGALLSSDVSDQAMDPRLPSATWIRLDPVRAMGFDPLLGLCHRDMIIVDGTATKGSTPTTLGWSCLDASDEHCHRSGSINGKHRFGRSIA